MKIQIFFFFLIIIIGCGQSKLDQTLEGPGYTISYSSDWKLDETKRNGAEFYLFYQPVTNKFGNNINLLIQDLKEKKINLDSYTEISQEEINTNGNLISSQRKTLNANKVQELIFEAVFNEYELKFFQYCCIKNDKAYVVTFTALKTEFDTLLPKAIRVLNSIQFK